MPFYFRKECPLNSGYLILWCNTKQDFPVTTDNVTGKVTELSHKISQYLRCIKTPYICFSKGG
ncbi:hypothetical protein AWP64_16020 [Escherichia coli]|nr:hypothetical protein AWP64_16020 [Escherichia coli]